MEGQRRRPLWIIATVDCAAGWRRCDQREEKPFAEEALRLGDHEMDLAFAAAVRDAEEHPPSIKPEAKEIQARLQQAERAVEVDKAESRGSPQPTKAGADKKVPWTTSFDVQKLTGVDQDEAMTPSRT